MENYINNRIQILKQLGIWGKISKEEKKKMKACTTEIQVDNWMTTFRHKYICV